MPNAVSDTANSAPSTPPVPQLSLAPPHGNTPPAGVHGRPASVRCLFCDDVFAFPAARDPLLAHLYVQHRLIISDVDKVALLDEYLAFWRGKFEAVHFDPHEYCTTMLLNHLPDRTPTVQPIEYFLLSDELPLDRDQRVRLHQRRLTLVLARHQFERQDTTYARPCLFCRETPGPTRASFVDHLFRKHSFHLGRPENLVYIDELLDSVCDKLAQLVCLFCAKTFKDRPTLKEHMRKKGHRHINPDDKQYDRFYMVNYSRELPPTAVDAAAGEAVGRQQAAAPQPAEAESRVFQTPSDSDSDWSDWEADDGDGGSTEASAMRMRCLFCAHTAPKYTVLTEHMRVAHVVDLDARLAELTFHKKVKLVNYVRHQMNELRCVTCEQQFETAEALTQHLTQAGHFGTGAAQQWDKPMFLFPLYEEDPLLFCLDDGPTGTADGGRRNSAGGSSLSRSGCGSPVNMADGVQIYAEEIRVEINEDAEALSREFTSALKL